MLKSPPRIQEVRTVASHSVTRCTMAQLDSDQPSEWRRYMLITYTPPSASTYAAVALPGCSGGE
eukprot:10459392-Lingulodinium_polyedra.AAC.1